MKNICYCVLFVLTLSIFSCKENNMELDYLFRAQEIMVDEPENALALLDSIKYPEKFGKKDYMNYVVATVRAKHKNYMDIKGDSLILAARDYLEQSGAGNKEKMLAYYYAGCYHREHTENDEALPNFLQSLDYAKQTGDGYLIGYAHKEIGNLYYYEDTPDSAIAHFELALPYFEELELIQHQVHLHRLLGLSNNMLEKYDKAIDCFEKGLQTSFANRDSTLLYMLYYGLGVSNKNVHQYKVAIPFFNKSSELTDKQTWKINADINLLDLYTLSNNMDSANYYASKILEIFEHDTFDDLYIYRNAYDFLSKLKEKENKMDKALQYNKLKNEYHEKITKMVKDAEIFKIERKYSVAQRDRKIAVMQKRELGYMTVLVISVLAIGFLFFLIRYLRSQNKVHKQEKEIAEKQRIVTEQEKALIAERNEILEQEKKIAKTRTELIESKNRLIESENKLVLAEKQKIEEQSKLLDQQLKNMSFGVDIYKTFMRKLSEFNDKTEKAILAARKPQSGNNGKIIDLKISEKIYENFQSVWKDMKSMKESSGKILADMGMAPEIIQKLKPNDLMLLALIHCKFEQKDIGDILNCNSQAVSMRKIRIKEKLRKFGLSEEEADFFAPKLNGENN